MKNIVLFILSTMTLSACTDATFSKYTQLGSAQEIRCYSGGVEIYHGHSTGKVMSEGNSDGYYFTERSTNSIVEISADCIFRNSK